MSARDQKFEFQEGEAGEGEDGEGCYPPLNAQSEYQYFYRKTREDGKALPYFYDIELLLPPGPYYTTNHHKKKNNTATGTTTTITTAGPYAVQTWHGKPGKYMWRNHKWVFATAAQAHQKVRQLIKDRANFKGGPFLRHGTSCRYALPTAVAAVASETKAATEKAATTEQQRQHKRQRKN